MPIVIQMVEHQTDIIVLRKILYSESSLVVNTLSPNFGRVDLIVKGARRIEKKRFPEIDLFNELSIFYKESRSGSLHTLLKSELLSSSLDIANYPANFAIAKDVADFILLNTHYNMHTEKLYRALVKMLSRFSQNEAKRSYSIFIKLVYLDEQGFLPRFEENGEFAKFATLLKEIFSFCFGETDQSPNLTDKYLLRLENWVKTICDLHTITYGRN